MVSKNIALVAKWLWCFPMETNSLWHKIIKTPPLVVEDFSIKIGLHQGSSLSLYLFTLVLDVLTKYIQDVVSKCMLFVDDIVLIRGSQ